MSYSEIAKKEKPIDALKGFTGEFMGDRLEELKELDSYQKSGSFDEIRALAHKWKGFSEPYGFQTLAALSKDLEVALDANDVDKSTQLIEEIKKYLLAKKAYILG